MPYIRDSKEKAKAKVLAMTDRDNYDIICVYLTHLTPDTENQ